MHEKKLQVRSASELERIPGPGRDQDLTFRKLFIAFLFSGAARSMKEQTVVCEKVRGRQSD